MELFLNSLLGIIFHQYPSYHYGKQGKLLLLIFRFLQN